MAPAGVALQVTSRFEAEKNVNVVVTNGLEVAPGSFRDRHARVFLSPDGVYRTSDQTALEDWRMLAGSSFFQRFVAAGAVIATTESPGLTLPESLASGPWVAVLEHERVPLVTYPYEWCFGMLKDAALLQLDLQLAALDEGMTLKDASPFNIQWRGATPVFIDISSFERSREGEAWSGYRQFCQMFLYPLFLQAYKDMPFQPWLRGRLDGISPAECARLMSVRDQCRPGVWKHATLHAWVERRAAGRTASVTSELRAAGFHRDLVRKNVSAMRRLVAGLRWQPPPAEWSEYGVRSTYDPESDREKLTFVDDVLQSRSWETVLDLGCNTGSIAVMAARHARTVVAVDRDHVSMERLYATLKTRDETSVIPLVADLLDPSPNQGWQANERTALFERTRPDLVLCLALIHHVVITGNVPVSEFIAWLARLTEQLVIEFVSKNDPRVTLLLRNKHDTYYDYDIDVFEQHLACHFHVVRRQTLACKIRVLYHAIGRRAASSSR